MVTGDRRRLWVFKLQGMKEAPWGDLEFGKEKERCPNYRQKGFTGFLFIFMYDPLYSFLFLFQVKEQNK